MVPLFLLVLAEITILCLLFPVDRAQPINVYRQ